MEQMSGIRDQQESLAKLHFELGARQDPSAPLSEEGKHPKIFPKIVSWMNTFFMDDVPSKLLQLFYFRYQIFHAN
jgi:hypothetical protein